MTDSLHAVAGIAGLLALAWAASEKRGAVPWRAIGAGLALEIALALVFLKVDPVRNAFLKINDALLVLEHATTEGTSFVFGYLGGAAPPFAITNESSVFILAFRALPLVL